MKAILLLAITFLSFVTCLIADSPSLLPAAVETDRVAGFEDLYNMNYAKAKEHFVAMTKTAPDHPAGYIYLAGAVWVEHLADLRRLQTQLYNKNDAFFTGNAELFSSSVDKTFQALITKGIQLAQKRVDANKNDVIGLYYLGVANGALAGYEATVKRNFFPSLKAGSRAVDFHKKVLKNNPRIIDAYLSVGMYNYIVGSLPLPVKILAFLGGVTGSKSEGLKTVLRVYKEGRYAKDEAGAILILLYDREKETAEALTILQELTRKYPGNFIFRMEMGRKLSQLKRFRESFVVFEELLTNQRAMSYMPDLIHFQYAESLFDARQFEKAGQEFLAASFSQKAPQSLVSVASLEAGKCLDASGKRTMAQAEYQYVLKLPDAFHSHDEARKYLKDPFVP